MLILLMNRSWNVLHFFQLFNTLHWTSYNLTHTDRNQHLRISGNKQWVVISLLLILATFVFFSQTGEKREIHHFHYTTWPDFGVPESPASFLNFLFKVRESGALGMDHGPAVVHCSAGIGRSGTFSLVDTCLVLVSAFASSPPFSLNVLWGNKCFFLFAVSHQPAAVLPIMCCCVCTLCLICLQTARKIAFCFPNIYSVGNPCIYLNVVSFNP